MNTAALKTFAPTVRCQLMEAVTRKLDFILSAQTPDYLTTFAPQVTALRELERVDRAGLIERVAYTWFNRFAALRYLDAKGWHPFRARVLTPFSPEETQPELLKLTRNGNLPEELRRHTDADRLNDLLDGRIPTAIPDADPQGEVYRHLVLAACRFYYTLLPDLFEKLDDETELLLPDDLLTERSVVYGFRTEIADEDCAEVELLGWLYQFYIAEKKDQVMARKSAVPTQDIPAVTQLFTPHWIVRYLVENSLGRLWLLNHPGSRLREQMPYYIEGEGETEYLKTNKPEEIRLLDPAVGSGHMLTYAFDLLYAIYEEEGYAPSDIAGLILTHNLYGVDIDQRAAQLASMALVLKAREKSRRFFQNDQVVRPHIIGLQNVSFEEGELREYIKALKLGNLFDQPVLQLMRQFEHATTFGSLIQPELDEAGIAFVRRVVEDKDLGSQMFLRDTHFKVLRVLEQGEALTQRYHVVVTNPPYVGTKQMPAEIKGFAESDYPDSKADLFAMFIERAFSLVVTDGTAALVTMQSWMFLSSFQALRVKLLNERTIITATHMGNMVMGIAFGTVATVWSSRRNPQFAGKFSFVELSDLNNDGVPATFPVHNERLRLVSASQFECIPAKPIAYWLSHAMLNAFRTSPTVEDVAKVRGGMTTGDNARFLRLWQEVSRSSFGVGFASRDLAAASDCKWFPYNKGGAFRRWYGNQDFVVNWKSDGQEILSTGRASPRSRECYFHEALTYTSTSSSYFAVRYSPVGFLFDAKGSFCVPERTDWQTLLGLLNSKLVTALLKALNPTIEFQAGDISRLPFKELVNHGGAHSVLVQELVRLGRTDWDNFETSWDFSDLPLLRPGLKEETLAVSWQNRKAQCDDAIRVMQELETENNGLFIDAYALQDELTPEVPEDEITLARADARRDMAAFLSYAVGCMMGRYSLDQTGLILADAGDTLANYQTKVGKALDKLTFTPDEDGIIPVLDGEWFEDDIVARTREFLLATFGKAILRENITFIEESLGKDLRKYFLTDFYKNHISNERAYGYKKRPIYWLVQSPKKGFSALVYLHRYTRDTMNLVLNRYLRPYQDKLRSRLERLAEVQLNEALSTRDKTAARKEADKLTKTLRECEEWERDTVLPLAQARIELDLDDGVKVNYQKLGEALAPIVGLAAAEE
jgi:hypothetical protein